MAGVTNLNTADLDNYVGKSIEKICPLGFGKVGDAENHCAHFVSHVLKINDSFGFGLTCAGMTFEGKKKKDAGACLRVNEIYNHVEDLETPNEKGCLVYFTLSSNIDKSGLMGSQPKKHVGIYFQGFVYNYGNTKDAVRKNTLADLKALYGATTITRFTVFPDGIRLLKLDEIQNLAK